MMAAKYDPLRTSKAPLVMAHRGGKGIWPENTLFAFKRALESGADVLEMDIRSTADGVPVVIHDPTVDRTTDGSGPVKEFTSEKISRLDAGYHFTADRGKTYPFRNRGIRIPTVSEVFSAFPGAVMNIDIKSPEAVFPFCKLIRSHRMIDRTIIASFSHKTLTAFRKTLPEASTSASELEIRFFFVLQLAGLAKKFRSPAVALQIPEYGSGLKVLTHRFITAAHRNNLAVHVWTVNEESDMGRLLNMQVDGIITDYPGRLRNLITSREPSMRQ